MWRRILIGALAVSSLAAAMAGTVVKVTAYPYLSTSEVFIGHLTLVLPALGWSAAGCVLAAVRPRNLLGWLFLTFGVLQSYAQLLRTPAWMLDSVRLSWEYPWTLRISSALTTVTALSVPTVILALYPDGKLPARWWRWPAGAAIAGMALLSVYDLFAPTLDAWGLDSWDDTVFLLLITPAALTILIATIVRWRRAVYPYRQQLSWFVLCGLVPLAFEMGGVDALVRDHFDPDTSSVGHWLLILLALLTNPLFIMPIGIAVGVLRYRLLGIRTVLRRSLVYLALTAMVFTIYLTVTAVLGSALDRRPVPGVIAAALIAVALAPARDRLQRAADRLVYGARRDPLRALADLSDSVTVNDHADLIPAAVAAVAAAVRADGAAIVLPDGKILAHAGQEPPAKYLALPLRFGGTDIGTLRVAEPPAGERYSDADLRLLTALTAQLAVVVSATELSEALEAERTRVVTATRDERDRLRRDLHDGLGPSLAGMGLGLQALSGLVGAPDTPAGTLVQRLRSETDTAVRDIRRIIDGLRPTALDTAGLTQAVERHAGTLGSALPVDVTADHLPVLAPDVEVAAYRIITEALTNVARHAGAHHAQVTISADEALHIAVTDDGHGIHTDSTTGVGLSSMRRRAEELGGGLAIASTTGGTTITATLPLSES